LVDYDDYGDLEYGPYNSSALVDTSHFKPEIQNANKISKYNFKALIFANRSSLFITNFFPYFKHHIINLHSHSHSINGYTILYFPFHFKEKINITDPDSKDKRANDEYR